MTLAAKRDEITKWLASGDTGLSSLAIVYSLTRHEQAAQPNRRPQYPLAYPLDAADFGRCHRMLKRMPWLLEDFHHIANESDVWRCLVQAWPLLTAQYEASDFEAVFYLINCCAEGRP